MPSLAAFGEDNVGGVRCRNVFRTAITELWCVNPSEKVFSGAEQDRRNRKVHFVDESRAKVLLDRGDTSAEADVLAAGSGRCSLQRSVDAICDEMKRRASIHRNRFPAMVGKHEYGCVVRWVLAPPALPRTIGPLPSDRSEHVATQDPRTDIFEPADREVVINACRAAILSKHLSKRTRGEGPFV